MRAAHLVAQVGAALDAAHARRLVHRDVKPANVLIAPGDHAYLTDFGLVKALDETRGQTITGNLVGTLDYVAPERIRGEGDGPAADLYSLGCVLYFTLTGTVPFPLEGTERKLWAHLSEPPPALDSPFDAVIARALAKDPLERYESGAALGVAAIAAAGGSQPSPPAGRGAPLRAGHPRRGARFAGEAAGLLAAFEHAADARRAAARGAGRHAAGADRAPAGRGARGAGPRQGASSSPRSPGTSRCSARCRARWPPSTPTPSGS